jgi:hypothetical protein
MAVDFAKPATGDNYSTQFVPNLQGNFVGVAQMLDSSQTTVTGTVPQYVKRYNRTSTALEEWSGSAWAPITLQGIRFSSGNLAVGVAPIASVPWMVHTGTNRNVAMLDQSSMATLTGLTDAGASTALRLVGNTLVFSGNGSAEHGRFDASGNLGLGGTSAGERLSVFGTARIAGGSGTVPSLTLTGGSSNFQFNHASGSGVAQIANSGGALAFASSGTTTQMTLDNGRLGIGTVADSVARLRADSSDPTRGILGLFRNALNTTGAQIQISQSGVSDWALGQPGGVNAFSLWTGRSTGADGAELLRVLNTGQLLINRTTDSGLGHLQIAGNGDFAPASGNARIYARAVATANASLELSGNAIAAGSGLSVIHDNTGIGYLYNRQNAAIVFGTNNNAQLTLSSTGALTPQNDAGQNIGGPSNRWATAFASALSDGASAANVLVDSSSTLVRLGAGSTWTGVALAAGGTARLTALSDGRVYGSALHNNANPIAGTTNQYIGSGTYTPTLANNSNATSISLTGHRPWTFKRVGNVVSVSGSFSCGATAANTVTTVRTTVPIPSNFTGGGEGGGVAVVMGQSPFTVGSVEMDATLDEAIIRFVPSVTTTGVRYVQFQYEIL